MKAGLIGLIASQVISTVFITWNNSFSFSQIVIGQVVEYYAIVAIEVTAKYCVAFWIISWCSFHQKCVSKIFLCFLYQCCRGKWAPLGKKKLVCFARCVSIHIYWYTIHFPTKLGCGSFGSTPLQESWTSSRPIFCPLQQYKYENIYFWKKISNIELWN